MENFIQKWQEDNKFRAKIKLLLYGLFIVLVTLYAVSLKEVKKPDSEPVEEPIETNYQIRIPDKYQYIAKIEKDSEIYTYSGEKQEVQTTIDKTVDNLVTNYIYKNNNYYVKDGDIYVKTTKEEVYDVIDYTFIDLANINNYLKTAIQDNDQYIVYLKDIILDDDSDEYLVINVLNNEIIIDYTPLVKKNEPDITLYKVSIQIAEIE